MAKMIDLPWPPKELNPNARIHWAVARKYKKSYREDCYLLTKQARIDQLNKGDVYMSIYFHPPDRRKRDDDNMIASFKSGRDGVADALGIDDVRFRPHYFFEEPIKGGKVIIKFRRDNKNG